MAPTRLRGGVCAPSGSRGPGLPQLLGAADDLAPSSSNTAITAARPRARPSRRYTPRSRMRPLPEHAQALGLEHRGTAHPEVPVAHLVLARWRRPRSTPRPRAVRWRSPPRCSPPRPPVHGRRDDRTSPLSDGQGAGKPHEGDAGGPGVTMRDRAPGDVPATLQAVRFPDLPPSPDPHAHTGRLLASPSVPVRLDQHPDGGALGEERHERVGRPSWRR